MPDDITDITSGVVYNATDSPSIQPKDTPVGAPSETKVGNTLDGHKAIDDLFHEATDPKPAPEEGEESPPPEKEKPPAEKPPEKEKAKPAADPKGKPPVEEKKVEAPEEPKDKLAEVQLPVHAKPATVNSFNEVKRRAREDIARLSSELEATKAKLPKPGQALPPEVQKEFDELRAFRKVHDFQNDTDFKKTYIDPIAANHKSILSKLKQNGYSDEQVAKITEIGIDKLDWDPVVAVLPTATRRSIEALLVDNERILDKKAQALEEAKNAPAEFATRQKQVEVERKTQDEAAVQQILDDVLPKLDWFKETPVPATATSEEKTEIEGKNAFHREQLARLKTMREDNSPQMRGQMIASTLLAYQKQNEAKFFKAKFEQADTELKRIRKASTTRSSRNAPAPGDVPARQSLFTNGREALDNLHKQVTNGE